LPTDAISLAEFSHPLHSLRSGDRALSEEFYVKVKPMLLRMARRRGKGLSRDQIEDVTQEVFLSLLQPSTVSFDASRGDVSSYLLGRVLNAVKKLRQQNLPPNTVTLGIDEFAESLLSRDTVASADSIQAARQLLRSVPPPIKEAVYRVYGHGEPKSDVAKDLGMTRFALSRRLQAIRCGVKWSAA
jgi:RNA polymerase sigma factor (sigma-70 family)